MINIDPSAPSAAASSSSRVLRPVVPITLNRDVLRVCEVYHLMDDPTRFGTLMALTGGSLCVGGICDLLGVHQDRKITGVGRLWGRSGRGELEDHRVAAISAAAV